MGLHLQCKAEVLADRVHWYLMSHGNGVEFSFREMISLF